MIITREAAEKALTDLVEEVGEDFVYAPPNGENDPSCLYQHNGMPSCGVGRALVKLGVDAAALKELDSEAGEFGDPDTNTVLRRFDVTVTPEARLLFSAFQHDQDRRTPYGEALQAALDYHEECDD